MTKRVISYSLYGTNDMYINGAILNAKSKNDTYGNDWETWFYVYEDVPAKRVAELKEYADRIIPINKDFNIKHGTFWRFLPIVDENVEAVIVRDLDSRITEKEVRAVNEWLQTDKAIHIMRDASTHQMPIMAGILGFKKPMPFDLFKIILENPQFWSNNQYIMDQLFLARVIYPLTDGHRLVHDSFNHYELDGFRQLERTDRFIGEKILEEGIPEGKKELDTMNDRYIYFHRNIDLYNTEQFGAFLYEFMENLQIARKLSRTLVIPNVFIAPRNNEKILNEKHIYLKSLSLVPITNYLDLSEIEKRYVKLLPLAEFYEKTYSSPAIGLFNPERIELNQYIVNKRLMTPFGQMHIKELVPINSFGLNIISLAQNADFNKMNSAVQNLVVLENGRLGQPNWHAENIGLDYFWIRMSLISHKRLQEIADIFVGENNVRTKPTLMLHWRRGDFLLSGKNTNKYEKREDETNRYFQNYVEITNPVNLIANVLKIKQKNMEIKQIFLVTNNSDNEEIELFKTELAKFNIQVLEYKNNNEQDEGLTQQLIGAQCKYHLHGPSRYERMSAFGRWMIEERKRYYFNSQYITTMEVFDNVYFIEKII